MALYINNGSSETINVALVLHDPSRVDCQSSDNWVKYGWWVLGPGITEKPNVLDVSLATVNRFAALFAFTASNDESWQGRGNNWYEVSEPRGFTQCLEDNTNCSVWADFFPIDFAGHPELVTYIGPNANQVNVSPPIISIVAGENELFGPSFYVSGHGFIPGSTVTISWTYVYDGDLTQNSNAATLSVGSDGSFTDIIACWPIAYVGTLSVEAVDSAWGLNASATENVT